MSVEIRGCRWVCGRGAGSAAGGACRSRVAPVRPRTAGDVPARRGAASRTISAAARSGANCRESTRPGSLDSSPESRPARLAGRAGSCGEQLVISQCHPGIGAAAVLARRFLRSSRRASQLRAERAGDQYHGRSRYPRYRPRPLPRWPGIGHRAVTLCNVSSVREDGRDLISLRRCRSLGESLGDWYT